MGWGDCGLDSKGRPIGYYFEANCDYPGCDAEIDRGLAYACGGMHGENEGCEGYFCEQHLDLVYDKEGENLLYTERLCPNCQNIYLEDSNE